MMNNLFGFENFRERSQNLATILQISILCFHFLKTFAKILQKIIKLDHTNGTISVEEVFLFLKTHV